MKKRALLIVALVVAMMTCLVIGCTGNTTKEDTTAPVITVENVPTTCMVGDTVTIPGATATDNVDGDLTSKVKVTVQQLKASGEINLELLYEANGSQEQSFKVTSNTYLTYKIIYFVKDAKGNKAEKEFTLTAVSDVEVGTFTLNENSVDGFSLANGINGVAGKEVLLPSAIAIDNPGEVNISDRIEARLYEIRNGETSTSIFTLFKDFTEVKSVRIPAGEYKLVYSVSDAAGNVFNETYETSVTIAQPELKNYAYDMGSFTFDTDVGYELTGKKGLSWVNEYGELAFGNTSAEAQLDQTVGFTSNLTKIHQQIVAVTFNAGIPGTNGQNFYTVSARGSKNRTTMPNKETCTWPDYLFIRISTGRIESRVERLSDKEMSIVKDYSGPSLLDGKEHTLYVQWVNVGEGPEAADASIELRGWIDVKPAGRDNASFVYKAVVGDIIDKGTLTQDVFTELWNESTGAGWFTMDTYSPSKPHDDDHMVIKGFTVYSATETEFAVDGIPPVVSVDFSVNEVYDTGAEITLPTASVEGADTVKCYVIDAQGNKTENTTGAFTPATAGNYTISYEAIDENGNVGYKFFVIKVADRDETAPELNFVGDVEESITVEVGEEITLPTATAIDNADGDISSSIKVEIIGTEHVTDRTAGGIYKPMTAGKQVVYYISTDTYGNTSTKSFEVIVTSNASGNMLEEEIFSNGTGTGLNAKEHIYDQKVSTIINISRLGAVVQFNARGAVKNNDWPEGLVIRFTDTNTISVSAFKHDGAIFGSTSYSKQKYMIGCDILFEYQVKNVVIDGVEYIRVQIWVQEEELVFNADANFGGIVGLEEGVNAIYRKLSDFTGNTAESIYSSPFWVSAYNSDVTVKEVRIDGTSCQKPADPVIPNGYEITFNNGHEFVEGEVSIPGGGDEYKTIGKNSNEEYIEVTYKGEEASKGAFCLNITGVATGWSGGIFFRHTQDGFEVQVGSPNGATVAYLSGHAYQGGINANEYTLVYKMTYIKEYGVSVAIKLDIWHGLKGSVLTKIVPTIVNDAVASYDATTDEFIILATAFSSAENMSPRDITVVSLGALNGTCNWTVTKVRKLDAAPGEAPDGYENPVNGQDAVLNFAESVEWSNAAADNFLTPVTNLNENYVAITAKHSENPTYYAFGINVLGSTTNGWNGGLFIVNTSDGAYFRAGGINNANLARLNIYSMGGGQEYTIAYKIKYITSSDVVIKVQIEVWHGVAGSALTKAGTHENVNSGDKWYYDTTIGAFVFDYDVVTADMIAPDCTVVGMSAWNNQANPCIWTITNVVVSKDVPKLPASVINGFNNDVTVPDGFDDKAHAVENLGDEYVIIDFSVASKDGGDVGSYAIGVNVFGQATGAWFGGIVVRIQQDGMYIKYGGINDNGSTVGSIAQTNLYSMSGIDRIIYRITNINIDGDNYKLVEFWAGSKNGEMKKVGNHAIVSGMETFLIYDESYGGYLFNEATCNAAGFSTVHDCSFLHPAALNANATWTVKVTVATEL